MSWASKEGNIEGHQLTLLQWTVDTETSLIGWKWIARDGSVSPLALYRVGGRLYPVGSLTAFNTATGGVSSASKYEVTLKYELVA